MKALVLEEPGTIEGLKMTQNRQKPIPKDNEILVKVYAAALNPSDYQMAEFAGFAPERKPVLGLDVAGTIEAIGNSVDNFQIGDRVYYLRSIENLDGGFAEYSVTTAHTASRLPDSISFEAAATVPGAGFTAYQAIVQKLRPEAGKTILIHGGSGGVGGFAIQFAKHVCGLTVYTSCQGAHIDYVKNLGADVAIDYQTQDVHDTVLKLTGGRGIDYVLNTLGTDSATKDLDILAFGGELVVTAGFPDFSKIRFFDKGISVHEIALGASHTCKDPQAERNLAHIGDEVARLLESKKVLPPATTVISMEQIPEYLGKLKKRKVTGKVVAKIVVN